MRPARATRPGPRLRVVGGDGRSRRPAEPEPAQVLEADLPPIPRSSTVSIEVWDGEDAPEGALPLRCAQGARISLVVRPADSRPDG